MSEIKNQPEPTAIALRQPRMMSIVLNRPRVLNSLDLEMIRTIEQIISEVEVDQRYSSSCSTEPERGDFVPEEI